MSVNLTAVQQVVQALEPIMTFVSPIAITSIFLYFIRSFFD